MTLEEVIEGVDAILIAQDFISSNGDGDETGHSLDLHDKLHNLKIALQKEQERIYKRTYKKRLQIAVEARVKELEDEYKRNTGNSSTKDK